MTLSQGSRLGRQIALPGFPCDATWRHPAATNRSAAARKLKPVVLSKPRPDLPCPLSVAILDIERAGSRNRFRLSTPLPLLTLLKSVQLAQFVIVILWAVVTKRLGLALHVKRVVY